MFASRGSRALVLAFGVLYGGGVKAAPGAGAQLAQAIREAGLDPDECYRVRDLSYYKEDIKLYFNEGYLVFSKPVNGERVSAVFSADVEGGDGEVILFPPNRGERQSMARFTNSPNLDEHMKAALMIFSDDTLQVLYDRIKEGAGKKAPEMGPVLVDTWNSIDKNIIENFDLRLVVDLLKPDRQNSRHSDGLFFLAIAGNTLGSFDILNDPRLEQSTLAGQISNRPNGSGYDIWAHFDARSRRTAKHKPLEDEFRVRSYQIDTSIENDLKLKAVTRATVQIGKDPLRVLPFDISRAMEVTDVRVDGKPAEFLFRESTRGRALRADENESFLVVSPETMSAGSEHVVEFQHNGAVITPAGKGVYFVHARSNWYPQGGYAFSNYDLKFRYPRAMSFLAAGDLKDESIDGDYKVSHFVTPAPIRVAGFNLGEYEKVSESGPGFHIDVYGNRNLEYALAPKPRDTAMFVPNPLGARGRAAVVTTLPQAPPPPDPLGRLREVADDVSACFQYFTSLFGAPATSSLTVAPIPASFGQGFPGLVYLSTIAYIDPSDRPASVRTQLDQVFFSDLIEPHEVAHQWWGNVVVPAGYQDEWIVEGLANYSALLYLEKKRGQKALEQLLSGYRDDLLAKETPSGKTLESAGPMTWGYRIQSSTSVNAWRAIRYEKGAWVFHMLRKRLGNENFFKMLAEMRRRYEFKVISTEDLRALAKEFLPAKVSKNSVDLLFDNWVYSTGVPALKMTYSVKGAAPQLKVSGTIDQTGVDTDFSAEVPIEIQFAKSPARTVWVETSDEAATFEVTVKEPPVKVSLGIGTTVLASRK
jgi:hypothetical protein